MSFPVRKNQKERVPSRELAHSAGSLVSAFESETAAVFLRTAPNHEHIVLYVLLAMLLLAFGLSAVVKLDRVVTGAGRVVPIGGELFISPLDRSIVNAVNVKAGDVVKKGQVLATLDPTFARADLKQLEERLASDEAEVARLQAEQASRPYQPADTQRAALLQASIWQQHQAEHRAALADFDARIENARATAEQYAHDAGEYRKRLKLATEQEEMHQTLEKGGYVSRLQSMTATDTRVEVGRLLADSENQLAATRQTLASLIAQRATYEQKWRSDIGTELVTSRNDLDKTRSDWQKAKKLNELNALAAPADAVVLKVARVSAGAVADSSGASSQGVEPLFTLVPLDAPVEADVTVDARDVGFIQPGDTVRIKLDAYRFLQHGTATGVIKTISEGSFTTDETTNQPVPPYFKARIAFTEVKLRNVPATFRLIPGMTLAADVLVGRRTILSYLVEGALRTGSEAMREP